MVQAVTCWEASDGSIHVTHDAAVEHDHTLVRTEKAKALAQKVIDWCDHEADKSVLETAGFEFDYDNNPAVYPYNIGTFLMFHRAEILEALS